MSDRVTRKYGAQGNSSFVVTWPQIPVRLPARLNAEQTAELLGFAPASIPVLVSCDLLKALASPKQQSVKYFSRDYIEKCAADLSWLEDATQAVYDHTTEKNGRKSVNRLLQPLVMTEAFGRQ